MGAFSNLYNGAISVLEDSYDAIMDGADTAKEKIIAYEKEMEKDLIKTFFVPAKKLATKSIKNEFDTKVDTVVSETKTSLDAVSSQLNTSIKGQFSTSIKTSMDETGKLWDAL